MQPHREFGRDLSRLHALIDWSRCVIMGSFALREYLRASGAPPTWLSNDIDIACDVDSHDAFRTEIGRMQDRLKTIDPEAKLKIEQIKLLSKEERNQNSRAIVEGREERFHDSIVATSTLRIPSVTLPVQLIALDTASSNHRGDIVGHLACITDLPAAVSYRIDSAGQRIFHVPEKALSALATCRVSVHDCCPARIAKYTERGFVFYDRI